MEFTKEQREYIDTYYQLLPLDADGVPIRVGDKLIAYNERFDVDGVGDGTVIFRTDDDGLGELFNPAATIHVRPRTLEDVLSDFAKDVHVSHSDFVSADAEEAYLTAAIAEAADEIRELLGGDAE